MEEELGFSDYMRIMRKDWLLVLIQFIFIFGVVIAYTLTTAPIYEAQSLVMVNIQDPASMMLGLSAPRVDIETQREIIMSMSVLAPIYAEFSGEIFKIEAQTIKNTNIIDIRVESTDSTTSMMIANKIAESYIYYTRESKKQNALEVKQFINEQLEQYQTELDNLNQKIADYESKKQSLELEIAGLNEMIDTYAKDKKAYSDEISVLENKIGVYSQKLGLSDAEKLDYENSKARVALLESLYSDATAKQQSYNELITKNNQGLKELLSSDDYNYKGLSQNIAAKQKIYDYLLSRGEEVGIVAQEKGGNVEIIQYASAPLYPVRPNFILNFLIGLIIAIIGSIGLVFLKETIKNNFKNTKEIEMELAQVLGATEKINKNMTKKNTQRNIENIRKIRTNILNSIKEKKMKLISFTSAEEKDGKSTIAVNVAKSLAQNNKKVLIVDANLRNPVLNKALKIAKSEPGLTDIIADSSKLDKVIKIRKTELDNLYLLSSGKISDTSYDILSSDKMQDVMKKLKESDFDIIIFDNSSLQYSESLFVSANSDGVIMVLTDNTNKDSAIESKAMLEKSGADLIGVILNSK